MSVPALALLSTSDAGAADVTAYADDYPPYHYLKNGAATGLATELLLAGCAKAKLACEVKILPWARAYAFTTTVPNTVLISIVRRPDREKDFVWLRPIMTESVWAFGRIDSPAITSISELKTRRTGVINSGSAERFLRDAGVPDSAMDKANSIEGNLRKLGARRIDYVIDTEPRMEASKAKFNMRFETVKALSLYQVTTYFVMNPQSDPKLVLALRKALDANNAGGGVRDQIIQKYLGPGQAKKK